MTVLTIAMILLSASAGLTLNQTTNQTNGNSANSGRITSVAVDPSDPSGNTVYTSSANGGVWKTTNF